MTKRKKQAIVSFEVTVPKDMNEKQAKNMLKMVVKAAMAMGYHGKSMEQHFSRPKNILVLLHGMNGTAQKEDMP